MEDKKVACGKTEQVGQVNDNIEKEPRCHRLHCAGSLKRGIRRGKRNERDYAPLILG